MTLKTRQTIRYVRASDGVKLAWAEIGTGMPLVKAATWLTHLEYDLESPVWQHWTRFLADHFRYIRYDERGCGMSDWDVRDLSLERRVADLESIIAAAGIDGPFVLLGMSQGSTVCVGYAVRHPDRVSRMILCGGYARGALKRSNEEATRMYAAIVDLATLWGSDNPAFRQIFTSRFIPDGSNEQLQWFNALCAKTVSPEIAPTLLRARAETDVTALLPQVTTPTLILHGREDEVVPLTEGRILAAEIPGAQFIELESRNHVLLEHEAAWARFQQAVLDFTGQASPSTHRAFGELSKRERETLSLLAEGLSNSDIAERLGISEKTVRNHLSHLFDKLGVWSRAQAIVFARDHGFRG